MKKLTIKYVKDQFIKEGYQLLTKKYINAHQNLYYVCKNSHKHNTAWSNWQQGTRCPYCAGRGKLTIEFIKSKFEKRGYKLLTEKYIGSKQKLNYICPNKHKHSIKWGHFRDGHGCPYCAGQGKPTIEFIRSEFKKEGYKLLTANYINNTQKLNYICKNGHKHSIWWRNWKSGKRCPSCSKYRNRYTVELLGPEFAKEGYTLLSEEYIGNDKKLEYVCPVGHKHSITWSNWQKGQRCSYCVNKRNADNNSRRLSLDFVKVEFGKEKYILLSNKYVDAFQKLNYICPNGHKHTINWHDWHSGRRCPYCVSRISNEEVEVRNFVESIGIEISSNNRNQIFNPKTGYGFELDIFMPLLNKAIEYNGEYWHKIRNTEDRDLLKQRLCEAEGIDLLTIWSKEWGINNEGCKEKIMKFIFSNGDGEGNCEASTSC